MIFQGMFFICLGVNLQQRMVEFWGMFFICLQGCEFLMNLKVCFFICLWCVNFWQRMDEFQDVFHMFTGVWISDNEESETKVLPKKKSDKSDICHTTHPYDIFSQFQELNGWKTGSHNVCLEFDGINSKNVTFIWFNLHAWGLIMSYYGLKWEQI